jgi:hypothetical protein
MKQLVAALTFLFSAIGLFAQQPKPPTDHLQVLYDESKVLPFTLPDVLVLLNGNKVKDAKTWKEKRRPEILKLFEENVYGRAVVGKPKKMIWELVSIDSNAFDGTGMTKKVIIYFMGKKDGPKMGLDITVPKNSLKPVPVFLVPGGVNNEKLVLKRGYGLANFDPCEVQPDKQDSAFENSIRKYFAKPDQKEPGLDEWGAIGVWAWAASRAMDYIVTDHGIDSNKVCIMGLSRFGKAAMWAGAQDERFAIVFSCESGCGGAVIVRRGFGETVRAINNTFPYWFCENFKSYNERVNDLPVDWHMLVALIAPRSVYISTAEEDYWGDQRGSFLAAKLAEPVYNLFNEKGLGVNKMPPVEKPVGDFIGFHLRKGTHGLNEYDWEQFLNFADRHFGKLK